MALTLVAACGGGDKPDPKLAAGRAVFLEHSHPKCGLCHTLQDAATAGKVGPNLDQLRPDSTRIVAAVTNGVGIMPAQGENLSKEQIEAVAYYLTRVTGSSSSGK